MKKLRSLLRTAVLSGCMFLSAAPFAQAASVTFNYNTIISGSTPTGTSPWVTSVFTDGGANTVYLTMSTPGLSGSENIAGMYFNLDPSLNLSSLSFTYDGSSSGPQATSVTTSTDTYKADGDGKYDILFSFTTGSGFNAGETVKYAITGTGISATSFNFLSACGNPSCSGPGNFYAAAKVQNISGNNSGWIASNVGVVPIPAALWLFGSGLLGLFGVVRRKGLRSWH